MNDDPIDTPNPAEHPEPEVLPKATRRRFTAKQKLAHVDAVASLKGTGQIGQYLREHGLYHAQLSTWRQAFDDGGIDALRPKSRGPKPLDEDQLELRERNRQVAQLLKQNEQLQKQLAQANAIIEVQKKLAILMNTLDANETQESDS